METMAGLVVITPGGAGVAVEIGGGEVLVFEVDGHGGSCG